MRFALAAVAFLLSGAQLPGRPTLGAWLSYGLGSENHDLPAFVVLPDVAYPQGGAANWSNGFFSPHFQGTPFRAAADEIPPSRPGATCRPCP